MPVLSALVLSIFGGVFSYLARYFAQKTAIAGAAVAAFSIVIVAMFAAIQAIIGGINLVIPQGPAMDVGFYLCNVDALVAAVSGAVAADAAIWLYRYQLACIKAASFVT